MGIWVISAGVMRPGRETIHLLLVTWLKLSGALPLLFLYAFVT